MADIETRASLGRPLAARVVDQNIVNLNDQKADLVTGAQTANDGGLKYDASTDSLSYYRFGSLYRIFTGEVSPPAEYADLVMEVEALSTNYPVVGFTAANLVNNGGVYPQTGTLNGGTIAVTTPFDVGRSFVRITGFTNPGATGIEFYLDGPATQEFPFARIVVSVSGLSSTLDMGSVAYSNAPASDNGYTHKIQWNNYTGGYTYNTNPWDVINRAWQYNLPVTIEFE